MLRQAKEQHALDLDEAQLREGVQRAVLAELEHPWNQLFEDVSTDKAKKLSRSERDSKGIHSASYVYGEISFASFGLVFFNHLKDLKPGGVFYDLGSGSGRGVFAAAALHQFRKLVGIEALEGLYQASQVVLHKFVTESLHRRLIAHNTADPQCIPEISFFQSDFLEYDWSDGDLIFANSTW
jgi:hypothetical protein